MSEPKPKYLGTIGGGIAPFLPTTEREGSEMEGAQALVREPTVLDGGIGGLRKKLATA